MFGFLRLLDGGVFKNDFQKSTLHWPMMMFLVIFHKHENIHEHLLVMLSLMLSPAVMIGAGFFYLKNIPGVLKRKENMNMGGGVVGGGGHTPHPQGGRKTMWFLPNI